MQAGLALYWWPRLITSDSSRIMVNVFIWLYVTGVAVSVPPLNSPAEDIVLRGDKMQLGPAVAMMFTKV